MNIYTASLDYSATGEGCTLMAYIDAADNEDSLRAAAAGVFGEYFAIGLRIEPGIVENEVTTFLFSRRAFDLLRSFEEDGHPQCLASFSFNLS